MRTKAHPEDQLEDTLILETTAENVFAKSCYML